MVKPTGWHTVKYENVDGRYLYNRCHLIGYQLTGENANRKNLITGTRYLNVTGMLPFENEVADYVHSTGNPCMYRVTPFFKGDELVARLYVINKNMERYLLVFNGFGFHFHTPGYQFISLKKRSYTIHAGKNRVYGVTPGKILIFHEFT